MPCCTLVCNMHVHVAAMSATAAETSLVAFAVLAFMLVCRKRWARTRSTFRQRWTPQRRRWTRARQISVIWTRLLAVWWPAPQQRACAWPAHTASAPVPRAHCRSCRCERSGYVLLGMTDSIGSHNPVALPAEVCALLLVDLLRVAPSLITHETWVMR